MSGVPKSRLLLSLVVAGTFVVTLLTSISLHKVQSRGSADHPSKSSLSLSSTLFDQMKPEVSSANNSSQMDRNTSAVNSTVPAMLAAKQNKRGCYSLFLLKTHKTGGTAIQNIVLRQAVLRNLTVGLSSAKNDWSRFCMERTFNKKCLCNRQEMPVDIIAHHMVFNRAQVQSSVKAGARYISIVRDPVDVIVSSYTFFSWSSKFKSFDDFISTTMSSKKLCSDAHLVPYRNLMMYVFGLRTWEFDNELRVKRKLADIMSTFDLIMVNGDIRFNQSLVLLKEVMGWTFDDVAVFSLNKQGPSALKPHVTESQRKLILQANHADDLLYKTSLAVFEEKVAKYGADRMQEQVKLLVERTEDLRSLCLGSTGLTDNNIVNLTLTDKGWTTPICRYMVSREKELTSLLVRRHNSHGYRNKCHEGN